MSICEICGKKTEKPIRAAVEGTEMNVCEKCAKFGKVISMYRPAPRPKPIPKSELEEHVVQDYDAIIKGARLRSNLTQEEFAKKLNEKLSVIKSIEAKRLVPDIKLTQKIESAFDVILIEELRDISGEPEKKKSGEVTLGDVITIKKKKA